MAKLKAGVIGLGMGWGHLAGYMEHPDVEVVAVADRIEAKRENAKKEFNLPKVYAEGIDMIRNEKLDILSVAVPNNQHRELTIAGLEAGANVLCEKPMAIDPESLAAVLAAAKRCGSLFLEGYMYRWHPQTAKLLELLRRNAVGEINLIESAMGFAAKYNPADRLFNPALGGGAVWDIGGYPLSMAMLVAGAALGTDPAPPDCFTCGGVTAPGNIDLSSCAIAVWKDRIVAQLACSCGATLDPALRIHGSAGRIVVPNPWVCNRTEPENGLIRIECESGVEEIRVPADRTSFGYEADGFARLLASGAREAAAAPFTNAESLSLNRLLCRWRETVTAG